MTFQQAINKARGGDCVCTPVSSKAKFDKLCAMAVANGGDGRPGWTFKENDEADTFYYFPHKRNYGHFPMDNLRNYANSERANLILFYTLSKKAQAHLAVAKLPKTN